MAADSTPPGSSGSGRQNEIYLGGLMGKRTLVPVPLALLEQKAKETLSPETYDYVAGGASSGLASVAAGWLAGVAYPGERLRSAWTRFLWHQFHDDLTGTSIPQAYQFSWNDELESLNQFAGVLTSATSAVSGLMKLADVAERWMATTASIPTCSAARTPSRTWSVLETVLLSQQIATGTPASRKVKSGCGVPRGTAPVW